MAEYIDREALMQKMLAKLRDWKQRQVDFESFVSGYAQGCIDVENAPVADVAEVKHGEWLPDYETFVDDSERESEPIQTGWVCSLCGRQEFKKEPYCHCGANMRGRTKIDGKEKDHE